VVLKQLYLYLIGMGEERQIDVRLDGVLLSGSRWAARAKA
jgi:hypothetical protein